MSRKKLNIGLFGFGCVGYGLHQVLEKTPGFKINVSRICVKNQNKARPIGSSLFTFDKNDILNDPEINVIVELIDDADAAYDIVTTALKNGKAVVSANKKLIAEHFEELLELQRKHNVPFLYEAACCASIPIVRNLEEYYDNDLLESIEGIVNGSTNYILTQTAISNVSYEEALREAQKNGFAESDPTLDTGGFDAKYKLLILLAHAFGIVVKSEDVFNYGIDRIGEIELRYAREKNLKIKLVAQAVKTSETTVSAFVLPKFIAPKDKLYNVDDVYNGVITKTAFADTQFFVGKGAGAYPTASAVLSDLSALSYDYRYEYKKLNDTVRLHSEGNILLRVLFRFKDQYRADVKAFFNKIEETYTNQKDSYLVGVISLASLRDLLGISKFDSSVILIDLAEIGDESKVNYELNHSEPLLS